MSTLVVQQHIHVHDVLLLCDVILPIYDALLL